VRAELFPAFIGRIDRIKKSHRIRHVDQNWHTQLGGSLPERVEALVIYLDPLAMLVTYMQPKRFPDFQTECAARMLSVQALNRKSREIIAQRWPPSPIHPAKNTEAVAGWRQMAQMEVKYILPPASIQINISHHPGIIQGAQDFVQGAVDPTAPKFITQVVMGVYDRKARLFNQSSPGNQFCGGVKICEQHGLPFSMLGWSGNRQIEFYPEFD
jgi:hypothetical protein